MLLPLGARLAFEQAWKLRLIPLENSDDAGARREYVGWIVRQTREGDTSTYIKIEVQCSTKFRMGRLGRAARARLNSNTSTWA